MTSLLIRLFVPNWKNTEDPAVRAGYGKTAGLIGIVTNFLLAVLKLITGLFFNSVAIMADAANSFSDSASSVVTLIGFKLSGKPADAKHPFGHARIEYIAGMMVSFIVAMLGFQLMRSSIQKIITPEHSGFTWITVAILIFSMIVKLWQGFFYHRIGKMISSSALRAAATDSLNDVIATAVVLIGILLTLFTGLNLDGWMGLAVAILIVISGIRLVIETSQPLLGTAPSKELVDTIYSRILSYDGVVGLHDLEVHSYGAEQIFASVHCGVDADQDILVSHDLIDGIERDFLEDMGIHLVIHLDPMQIHDLKTQELFHRVTKLVLKNSPAYSIHDFRVVWGKNRNNLIFDAVLPFESEEKDKKVIAAIKEAVQEEIGKNFFAVITIDHGYLAGK